MVEDLQHAAAAEFWDRDRVVASALAAFRPSS